MEFACLRKKLETYYQHEGQSDAVRISLPKGSYVPLAGEWIFRGGAVAKQSGRASAGTYRRESGSCLWPINKSQRPILAAFKCADHSAVIHRLSNVAHFFGQILPTWIFGHFRSLSCCLEDGCPARCCGAGAYSVFTPPRQSLSPKFFCDVSLNSSSRK